MLCRIFQKSGLGPPNGDRYAPFIEEEWAEDAPLLIPGGDVEDDVANGDDARGDCIDYDQVFHLISTLTNYSCAVCLCFEPDLPCRIYK